MSTGVSSGNANAPAQKTPRSAIDGDPYGTTPISIVPAKRSLSIIVL